MTRWQPWPGATTAEIETTFRFDMEEKTLECGTTSHRVANRWKAAGLPVTVLGTTREGVPRSWALSIPWTGKKSAWTQTFSAAVPRFETPSTPVEGHGGPSSGQRLTK